MFFNFILFFWRQKKQKPRHAERAVGSFFVHKLPLWQHSSIERALSLKPVVCFSGIAERPCQRAEYKLACNYKRAQPVVGAANIITRLSTLCVYNPRSDSLCLRRTLAALVVNVSKLSLTRLHKLSRYFRKTAGLSLCSLTVPVGSCMLHCVWKSAKVI